MSIEDSGSYCEGLDSQYLEGNRKYFLSPADKDYLNEAIETGDQEFVTERIDELTYNKPPKALDKNSEIGDLLRESKMEIDNKLLEAPNDFEQVKQISQAIKEIPGARYPEWSQMTVNQRLETLQEIESEAAKISHRPPCEVVGKELVPNTYGYFNPASGEITLNTLYISDNSINSWHDAIDTVLHEGRHAYQQYNVEVREVHPSEGDCTNWAENLYNKDPLLYSPPENYGYQDVETYGFERYQMQPVEADARAFAQDILSKFNNLI